MAAINDADRPVHPEDPRIAGCRHVVFHEPGRDGADAVAATSIHPGWLDRSPCGTGTSARLAQLHAQGALAVGEPFVNQSVIGTRFTGRVVEETTVAGRPAIIPEITGRAWITAMGQYLLDAEDPFPAGFSLVTCQPAARPVSGRQRTDRSEAHQAGQRTSNSRYAPRGMPARDDEVQALVEQLSAELDRSVLVDDASLRLLAYSPTLGSEDEVRRTAILTRETPRVIRDLHFAQGIATATAPVRTAPRPDIGLESRVCVPIRCQGALFGYLWLIDADQSLTETDCEAAERTAAEIGTAMYRRDELEKPQREHELRLLEDALRRGSEPARAGRAGAAGVRAAGRRRRHRRARDAARGATATQSSAPPSAPASASRWTSSGARCRAASHSAWCTATTA